MAGYTSSHKINSVLFQITPNPLKMNYAYEENHEIFRDNRSS